MSIPGSAYAVVYKSKYGASEKYARIIAGNLQADLFNADEDASEQSLCTYQTIIWCGGIYAGRINGADILRKHLEEFKGNSVIVVSVGNTPADRLDILGKVRRNSIPRKYYPAIKFHHFVARANFSALTMGDRIMFTFRRFAVSLKPVGLRSEGENRFLSECGRDMQVIDEAAAKTFAAKIDDFALPG